MSTTITIQKGDTLSEIVKKHYGLKGWNNIYNKCLEVQQANKNIKNINSIFAGDKLVLPDATEIKEKEAQKVTPPAVQEVKTPQSKKEVPPPAAPVVTTSPTINKSENMGKKFDDWDKNIVKIKNQEMDNAFEKFQKYCDEHPNITSKEKDEINMQYGREVEKSLQEKEKNGEINPFVFTGKKHETAAKKALELYIRDAAKLPQGSAPPSFNSMSEEYKTVASEAFNAYKDDLVKLAKDSIHNYENLDGDAETVNFEEFCKKEMKDIIEVYPDAVMDKEMQQKAKLAFDALSHNDKIDYEGEALKYALMDTKDGMPDGKINRFGADFVAEELREADPEIRKFTNTRLNLLRLNYFER